MPTLADIYSAADSFKRRLNDAAANPGASLQQMLGYANDRAANLRDLSRQAADETIAARDPFVNGPANKALDEALRGAYGPAGMTVWHGSPYKFTNFDASKIGKGEGAQAYGHGLYVAENPAVAQQYQQNVKDLDSIQAYNQRLKQLNKMMDEDSVYPGAYRKFKSEKGQKAADEYDALMEMRNQKSTAKGNLYKIDLPDEHIEKMIDWDKPLSQQPKNVQEALKGIEKNFPEISDFNLRKWMDADPLASTWHNTVVRDLGVEPSEISKLLQKRNVAGIKYYDQTSRNGKEGTRNFVVFPGNEHLLKIQDINGNPIK